MKKILVTGSTGFVGKNLVSRLISDSYSVSSATRKSVVNIPGISNFNVGDINSHTDWKSSLSEVECVIHVAALSHGNNESIDHLKEVNINGTVNLARQAADYGVKRFIFISSIKVNGESTSQKTPFSATDVPAPIDIYGISKAEAENELLKIGTDLGMEVVIIRPPLVYGPGVQGNFLSLLKLSYTSFPLPFASINNSRSMVYIGNLVDLVVKCIHHPAAANEIMLVSDDDDTSLSRLVRLIRSNMEKKLLLLPIPELLFKIIGKISGRSSTIERLVGDLEVDCMDTKKIMNWTPPFTLEQGVMATVEDYLKLMKGERCD